MACLVPWYPEFSLLRPLLNGPVSVASLAQFTGKVSRTNPTENELELQSKACASSIHFNCILHFH